MKGLFVLRTKVSGENAESKYYGRKFDGGQAGYSSWTPGSPSSIDACWVPMDYYMGSSYGKEYALNFYIHKCAVGAKQNLESQYTGPIEIVNINDID